MSRVAGTGCRGDLHLDPGDALPGELGDEIDFAASLLLPQTGRALWVELAQR